MSGNLWTEKKEQGGYRAGSDATERKSSLSTKDIINKKLESSVSVESLETERDVSPLEGGMPKYLVSYPSEDEDMTASASSAIKRTTTTTVRTVRKVIGGQIPEEEQTEQPAEETERRLRSERQPSATGAGEEGDEINIILHHQTSSETGIKLPHSEVVEKYEEKVSVTEADGERVTEKTVRRGESGDSEAWGRKRGMGKEGMGKEGMGKEGMGKESMGEEERHGEGRHGEGRHGEGRHGEGRHGEGRG
ncbi:unnamed protein product [Cyprideis torosa]|uniref:Uncharacterized protein n=1 Tax=Cyprideis torosa TaxID=163714 RepID=A0A7R8W1Y5_9CRUS|nr:unnamed protein product [Cyprideis torosa]CAG0881316.1 unnamed protein product [Cyprideis torosa]